MGRLLQVRELQATLRLLLRRLRRRHRHHPRHRHRQETSCVQMAGQVGLVQRPDRRLQRQVWGP